MKKNKKYKEYSIEIPRNHKYLFLVRQFLENIIAHEDLSEKDKVEEILVVNETCDKLFRMMNEDDGNIKIGINLSIDPKKFIIFLKIKGTNVLSLNLNKLSEDEFLMDSVKARIGDYLIEKSADEVIFSSSKRKGYQIKIIKYRNK
jgi:anti-sigma regulatory factor (Ser/Thr protein kinase)